MNPPIPDPFSGPPPRPTPLPIGPRPPALKTFISLELLLVVVGVVYCDGTMTETSVAADLAAYAVLSAIWLAFLWALWNGRNWGRIAVMIGCVLSVLSLPTIGSDTPLQQVFTVLNAIFGAIWFWWLRSPAVVAFYKGIVK